jgi:hypothetical protein
MRQQQAKSSIWIIIFTMFFHSNFIIAHDFRWLSNHITHELKPPPGSYPATVELGYRCLSTSSCTRRPGKCEIAHLLTETTGAAELRNHRHETVQSKPIFGKPSTALSLASPPLTAGSGVVKR